MNFPGRHFAGAQRHDGAFAKLLFDLGDSGFEMRMLGQHILICFGRQPPRGFALRRFFGRFFSRLFGGCFFFSHAIVHFDGGDHGNCILYVAESPNVQAGKAGEWRYAVGGKTDSIVQLIASFSPLQHLAESPAKYVNTWTVYRRIPRQSSRIFTGNENFCPGANYP